MKTLISLLLTLLTLSCAAFAQGSPDFFWDDSRSWGTGQRNFGCRLGVAPTGAQAFLLIESVPNTLLPGTWTRQYTALTPAGVHVQTPNSSLTREYGLISRTGQMVVYYVSGTPFTVMMSRDYGQTYLPLTLPTSATYTTFGNNGLGAFGNGNGNYYNSVIGQDDKFYIFYFTTRPNVSGNADRYELNMLSVDINGIQNHTVVTRISASDLSTINNYINVVSTNSEIVAVVKPGRSYRPRGGTVVHSGNVTQMAVVYNIASQNIDMINFGGTIGTTEDWTYGTGLSNLNNTDAHLRMLSTDGENIFMLNGSPSLPGGRRRFRLREFPKNPASFAGLFINTELNEPTYLPSWEPYMNLSVPAMDYGTYDDSFIGTGVGGGLGNPAVGAISDFTSKWGVGGITDHSADIYFRSYADLTGGITPVKRMRIQNPNSPSAILTQEYAEDFPVTLLASIFGPPQSNYQIPTPTMWRSHWGVEGSVASTFCYYVLLPPLQFYFHLTDFS